VNITPALGANLAGGMRNRKAADVHDELHAKALVLDNGQARLAIVMVDSCAVPGEIIALAKQMIESHVSIPAAHVLVAATHTHSAPAATHLFQSKPSLSYVEFLVARIADAVRLAVNRLAAAQVGYAVGKEPRLLFNRRFFLKPGTIGPDPFGRTTDKVKMNPGVGNPDIVKPAGPIDPDLGVLAVHTMDGRPLCVLGNYALHYVGGTRGADISADYFPVWGDVLLRRAGVDPRSAVTMMSNACSGNINNVDVRGPAMTLAPYQRIRQGCDELAPESLRAWREVKFDPWVELKGSLEEIELGVRLPTGADVAEAQNSLGKAPAEEREQDHYSDVRHIYARETVILHQGYPTAVRAPIQALRIGQLGIATFPGEAFVELGLEVKRKSPFRATFSIELANGYHGYIPTREAHAQGGYETWRAKSSYLEAEAAGRMVAAALRRLEAVAS